MTEPVTDDARDLAAARAGDETARARLYDRHGPVVLALCRVRAARDAEDATQETFIRAFRMLDQLDCPEKFRPWLYGIARRVCWERNRARRRRAVHEERFGMVSMNCRPIADTAADVEQDDQLRRLDEALRQLDDRQRLAIHLHYLDADPERAAAEALGLSRSGYYKLLARARERLAALMGAMRIT
jgi:RNA polymerase sigma-70 factor (ECF subfamily)